MKKLESSLRRKLSVSPSGAIDQKFWNRFEREFGIPAPHRRRRPRIWGVILPAAAATAALLVAVQLNRHDLREIVQEEKESNAGLEIVMDRELYENLDAFDEVAKIEEQVADLSEEELASLTGV